MPQEILEYVKKKVYPKGGDFIFSKMDEFFYRANLLLPKLDGNWEISLSQITFNDYQRLTKEYEDRPYISLKIYMKKTVINQVRENFPQMKIGESSNWDKFLHLVSNQPKHYEMKASREIYRRIEGNLDKALEVITKLNLLPQDTITVKEVRKEVLDNPKVRYARDLILTLLLSRNNLVPKKGHRYSKYRYMKSNLVLEAVLEDMGNEVTFYAIRKFLRNLYSSKLKYLRGETTQFDDLLSFLSIYEIAKYYILFESSQPSQLYAIISDQIEQPNVNIIAPNPLSTLNTLPPHCTIFSTFVSTNLTSQALTNPNHQQPTNIPQRR